MRLFRGVILRLTRISVMATLALALALPLAAAPNPLSARAAGSIVYQQYADAMTKVFAYRATVDEQAGTTGGQGSSDIHIVMDVIRKGKVSQIDAQITVSAGQMQAFAAEEVSTGTHVCIKITQIPVWNCQAKSLPGIALADLTPTNFLQQAGGSGVELKPVGAKTVAGVPSTGYTVYGVAVTAQGIHGAIWLDTANHRVTEFDWSEKSQNTQVVSLKMVYSHYNDKGLHISSVPAA